MDICVESRRNPICCVEGLSLDADNIEITLFRACQYGKANQSSAKSCLLERTLSISDITGAVDDPVILALHLDSDPLELAVRLVVYRCIVDEVIILRGIHGLFERC